MTVGEEATVPLSPLPVGREGSATEEPQPV
jgi:hypothetical protein